MALSQGLHMRGAGHCSSSSTWTARQQQQAQRPAAAARRRLAQQPSSVVASSSSSNSNGNGVSQPPVMLEVRDLEAKIVESGQQILNGVSLTVRQGEVHAIMGKNGSGKSTLSKVLVGHPDYEVTGGTATYKGRDLFSLAPEERSHEGLFLSFQSPIEIPGVSNVDFLRMACNARRKALGHAELDPLEFYAHVIPKVGLCVAVALVGGTVMLRCMHAGAGTNHTPPSARN
jgi:Fe-S cluster assembly ATP-binding protein